MPSVVSVTPGAPSDETPQHDDVEPNDNGVKQIVSADRRGVDRAIGVTPAR